MKETKKKTRTRKTKKWTLRNREHKLKRANQKMTMEEKLTMEKLTVEKMKEETEEKIATRNKTGNDNMMKGEMLASLVTESTDGTRKRNVNRHITDK